MRKAYDTILQAEVSADLVAKNGGFEPYRYECSCCGDVECENYLGQYGVISIDSRSRKSNRERAEFYFEKSNKTFCLGLRFSSDEINAYEQQNVIFELRSSATEQAFFTLPINNTNFAPDAPTLIPINKFSYSYFLSNTLNGTKRRYDIFKSGNTPIFFKLQGNDSDYNAKLVRSTVLYTNVLYLAVFQNQYSISQEVRFSDEIHVNETFHFKTMV